MTPARRKQIRNYLSGSYPLPAIEIRRMAVELEEELYQLEQVTLQLVEKTNEIAALVGVRFE
jgi:hypothetical protein